MKSDLCGIDLFNTKQTNIDSSCACGQATSLYKYVPFSFKQLSPICHRK